MYSTINILNYDTMQLVTGPRAAKSLALTGFSSPGRKKGKIKGERKKERKRKRKPEGAGGAGVRGGVPRGGGRGPGAGEAREWKRS